MVKKELTIMQLQQVIVQKDELIKSLYKKIDILTKSDKPKNLGKIIYEDSEDNKVLDNEKLPLKIENGNVWIC
jgi:hypothetical protein